MEPILPTPRTTLHRRPSRGSYDRSLIHAILDEALVAHVGFVDGGQPYVLPTTFARRGDLLYLHGAAAGRLLQTLARGTRVCVTVTLLDGLVLARSAFHHSMNYRSVVVLGEAAPVVDEEEKQRALAAIVDHVMPGRTKCVRGPNAEELRATTVLSLALSEASAKVRIGPPVDLEADLGIACWAGVLPLSLAAGAPVPDSASMAREDAPVFARGGLRR